MGLHHIVTDIKDLHAIKYDILLKLYNVLLQNLRPVTRVIYFNGLTSEFLGMFMCGMR